MVYFEIIKFHFLRFLTYPLEILTSVLKRVVDTLFFIILWSIVIKSINSPITLTEIISYFLIAAGIEEIVGAHWGFLGQYIGWRIKLGKFSNHLIKPLAIIPSMYATAAGRNGMRIIVAILSIIAGISISLPTNLFSFILFLLFFTIAFFLGIFFNVILGTMYFHIIDASGVKNSIAHMSRLLSGAMIPLSLFPTKVKTLVLLTPFSAMVFGPINVLRIQELNREIFLQLGVSLFWIIILGIISHTFWVRSVKKYEAVGI